MVLDFLHFFLDLRIALVFLEQFQIGGVAPPGCANGIIEEFGKLFVGQHQPAPVRDTICLAIELVGIQLIKIFQFLLRQYIGMKLGDTVNGVATENGHVSHPDLSISDYRHGIYQNRVLCLLQNLAAHSLINGFNNQIDPRKQILHHVQRPLFQCFGHDRVIGVTHGFLGNCPGVFPLQLLLIQQNSHEFRNAQGRMGVIDVDRHKFMDGMNGFAQFLKSPDDILNTG
ncbi:hypothetical protein SDC9_175178 [bioreactor metagenome]|uniref:Uncharacterized protein n=1 Tax=bioreactor metagenome TaxID=1076179 RepID=A0A645GUN7_9ZZZZ